MSAQEILVLAQQGDPRAIATLMNCITRPKGVNVRVQKHKTCLHILFEAEQPPNQDETVEFACESITTLEVEPSQLMIYGRQQGQSTVAWQQMVDLQHPQPNAVELEDATTEAPIGLLDPFTIADESLEPIQDRSEAPDMLKRPESVILLIFASIVLFWDTYIALLEEADGSQMRLSTSQLAQRLNTTPTILRHKKRLSDFGDWSRHRDPDGVAWVYKNGIYSPLTAQATAQVTAQ
jgi:hypothetical protein